MFFYRIYRLDDTDHIAGVVEKDCLNDQAALQAARQVSEPGKFVEVWQLTRCLGKIRGGR